MSTPPADLPPGWDTKFDSRTSRYYFINHYTKTTSWEDPRVRYQQIGKPTSTSSTGGGTIASVASAGKENKPEPPPTAVAASIPAASASSSTTVTRTAAAAAAHPHWTATSSASARKNSAESTSNLLSEAKADSTQLQDPNSRRGAGSPNGGRSGAAQPQMGTSHFVSSGGAGTGIQASPLPLQRLQLEESIGGFIGSSGVGGGIGSPMSQRSSSYRRGSNILAELSEADQNVNSEQAMHNVSAMFPTVDESHIKDLLKKSTNRRIELSYQSRKSPEQPKKSDGGTYHVIKAGVSYLKSVFPTVEEYLLLDVLGNSDNNVQKAADKLVKMGYVKRDTPSAPRLHARRKEEERLAEKRTPLPKPPAIKTDKEKEELRRKMRNKYEVKFDIPERILYMALESVLYDEEQANALITSMIDDDQRRKKTKELEKAKEKNKSPKPVRKVLENERQPRHTSPKHEPKKPASGKRAGWSKLATSDDVDGENIDPENPPRQTLAKGPNAALRKGPNDDLLLTDYVTWNGPDPDLRRGTNRCLAKGPNAQLRRGASGGARGSRVVGSSRIARGPNPNLRKGPAVGAAKGSIYAQVQRDEEASTRGN